MSQKSFCYKTLENYDIPKNQLESFCAPRSSSKSGYYTISNTRAICDNGQCRTRENYHSTPWQQPAAVRGTWDQVKGLYELNPQSNSCVGWRGINQEGYERVPTPAPPEKSGSCCVYGKYGSQEHNFTCAPSSRHPGIGGCCITNTPKEQCDKWDDAPGGHAKPYWDTEAKDCKDAKC